jgi:cell division protein FtsB
MIQAGYTYEPAWNEEIVIEPRKQRIVKKVVKKKANKRKKLLGKLGIGLFLYGIFLVGLCIQSASLGYQIIQLEKDISGLQTENDRIEYRIAQLTALPRIETVAQTELNMYKPDNSKSFLWW